EHEHLRQAVRRFAETRVPASVLRTALDAPTETRPDFWSALAEPGWVDMHEHGAGFVEQAVVVEELGRACAPGPYVPTAIVAALLQADRGPAAGALLPKFAAGELTGAVGLALDTATLVTGGAAADVIVCTVDGGWYALDA